MPNTKKRAGTLPLALLFCTLPGVVAAFLGLFLRYADLLSKNLLGEIEWTSRTLSEWGTQHDALRELGEKGYAYFGAARGFAWAIAVAAAMVFLLFLLSRFSRSKELSWCVAGSGALLVLASIIAFFFAVLFSVSAETESSRVLLSVAPYCTLAGGMLTGSLAFFAVRRDL